MIDAKNIMVGNWVKNVDEECFITQIMSDKLEVMIPLKEGGAGYYFLGYEHLEPIPITEKVLLACGFENLMDEEKPEWHFNGFYYHNNCLWFGTSQIEVKTLHQLMNLYFAISMEELSYQPLNQ